MTRAEMIAYAASRYGRRNPSPSDVLDERWPRYGAGDRIHVEGWHADESEVLRMVVADAPMKQCKVCAAEIPASKSNMRYCGPTCRKVASREKSRVIMRKRRAVGRYVSDDERERIIALYVVQRLSILSVAGAVRRAQSTVKGVLREAGIMSRSKTCRPPNSNSMSPSLGAQRSEAA